MMLIKSAFKVWPDSSHCMSMGNGQRSKFGSSMHTFMNSCSLGPVEYIYCVPSLYHGSLAPSAHRWCFLNIAICYSKHKFLNFQYCEI